MGDPLWRQGLGPILTWTSLCWKAANHGTFQKTIDIPRLGQLAGPIIEKLPLTWSGVRGPLGAASRSLSRIGWRFLEPFVLLSDKGIRFSLVDTSPAMLTYHMIVSWNRARGRSAATSAGLAGHQLDATQLRAALRPRSGVGYFVLLRAYATQSIWTKARLHAIGYDVDSTCPHCGAAEESLYHRLFVCPATEDLRSSILDQHDLEFLRNSPSMRSLALGFQVLPDWEPERPTGSGVEDDSYDRVNDSWTITGQPVEDFIQGEVFTDGSCFKQGPHQWHRTGWSVCKVSEDGVLLAYVRGRAGHRMPQTSPAAEHLPVLRASTITDKVTVIHSDYKGLEHLERTPWEVALHPKALYSGIRRSIMALKPPTLEIHHCPGHVSLEECTSQRERFLAMGNDHADKVAQSAALATQSPSPMELQTWDFERAFLSRWLQYVPRALAMWPSVAPSSGHASLPRRPDFQAPGVGVSFLSDVLGPLAAARRKPRAQEETPAPAQTRPEEHQWRCRSSGVWVCVCCLAFSRQLVPPRGRCPGLAAKFLKQILDNPRGHNLLISLRTDGKGLVLVCSRCGRCATRNREEKLHKEDCPRTFLSDGARSQYARVSKGMVPRSGTAEGDAKLLEPCLTPSALARLAAEGAPAD